jgi:hypothetical protein
MRLYRCGEPSHANVHIGILFCGLVHAHELSFLRTSPDSIVIAPEFHRDPALRNGRQAGPRLIAIV